MAARILVIDDTQAVRDGIVTLLRYADFEARTAENGEEGLALAKQLLPDLIICDILMPGMDGYEMLARLREDERTSTIPVIFLTAKTSRNDQRRGMELGADDYVSKPFAAEELLNAVRTRLERRALAESAGERKVRQLRRSIFDNLPHEMLTPLTGVIGYAELLRDGAGDTKADEVRFMAARIVDCGERLQHLVQNFLIFARIEVYASDPTRLVELRAMWTSDAAAVVAQTARRVADTHKRATDFGVDGETCDVQIRPEYLAKIVEELTDNACKFSQRGPAVSVRTAVDDAFRLEVRDQGRGMSPQDVARIAAYTQFERALYEQQGIGLGLVIAKRLAELHGGNLTIESEPSNGTTVRVILPRHR